MADKLGAVAADSSGRVLKYFRISVTDRCNYRCRYCFPQKNFSFISHNEVLRYEDMIFAAEVVASLGVEKIRVTGGEPLVRKNLSYFLSQIKAIEGIKEAALTTNGSLLCEQAEAIYTAGVSRLNISFDTLSAEKHASITGGGSLEKVLNGIECAIKTGFAPIKLNTVIIKGFNDDEILPLCTYAAEKGLILRFIEFMPIGNSPDWKKENIMTGEEILEAVERRYGTIESVQVEGAGPAKYFKLSNGALIGIITPISEHFCDKCDKLRLTADGKLRPCLLSDCEINAAEAIRKHDKQAFIACVLKALAAKNRQHEVSLEYKKNFVRTMSGIGG
jgi:cyclic pyranopterin phosphate synthase